MSCQWAQHRDASLFDVGWCFTLMIRKQGRRSRRNWQTWFSSLTPVSPRILSEPHLWISICIWTFFCVPQIISWPRSSKHGVGADAWISLVSTCDEYFSSWPGRPDNCCAHVEPLPHWKCLFRPHQDVCLFLCSVWELRLLSHQALLKWQLSSADS